MTNDGKALTKTLTEEPHAHGNAEGNDGYQCPLGSNHRCLCAQKPSHTAGCECIACESRWNNRLAARCVDEYPLGPVEALERSAQRLAAAERHAHEASVVLAKRAAHAANIAKMHRGSWAFTLTYSPSKTGWSHEEAKEAMRVAIRRLVHYYRHEIVEFEAVGELTQAGAPHVHGHYTLHGGRKITTKNFRRAYPIWDPKTKVGTGHVGGYHKPATSTSDYTGYIQKDIDAAWLVETYPPNVDATEEAHLPEAEGDDEAAPSCSDAPDSSPEPHDG